MKYMLLIYGNQQTWDLLEERGYGDLMKRHVALGEELTASGEFVGSGGLTVDGARTVRVRDGEAAITDGPYAEAKEVLAGYYLVECDSLERATDIARRIPEAELNLVEVRQLIDPRAEYGDGG
jgi:hypothetical protein